MSKIVELIPAERRPRRKVVVSGLSGPVVTAALVTFMHPVLAAVLGPLIAAVLAYLVPEAAPVDPTEPADQQLP